MALPLPLALPLALALHGTTGLGLGSGIGRVSWSDFTVTFRVRKYGQGLGPDCGARPRVRLGFWVVVNVRKGKLGLIFIFMTRLMS